MHRTSFSAVNLAVIAVLTFAFLVDIQTASALEESLWSSLSQITVKQKIHVLMKDGRAYDGVFARYDEESIDIVMGDETTTHCERENVLRVSVSGPSKRKGHILIGLLAGAAAGFATGLIANQSDNGSWFSDEEVGGALAVLGGGAGAFVGAVLPAQNLKTIYKSELSNHK